MGGPTNIGRVWTKEQNEKRRASNIKAWIDNEKGAAFANDMNPASVLSNKQALEIYKLALKRKDFVKKYGQYAKYDGLTYGDIGKKYGVAKTTVQWIIDKKQWKDLTDSYDRGEIKDDIDLKMINMKNKIKSTKKYEVPETLKQLIKNGSIERFIAIRDFINESFEEVKQEKIKQLEEEIEKIKKL
ncbi:MAG TPA: hypothetical protein PK122_02290 [Candidatus Paceibacterota bacterium]|nr:hypothetical protein [Candidatus Paceibacterota bacterium]